MKVKITEMELRTKAKDFANELTNHNVIEKSLTQQAQIAKERMENYATVSNVLLQRGVNIKFRK